MQAAKLYVGNLNYATTADELKEHFSTFGEVLFTKVIEGKGFGFVEFSESGAAEKAKEELNGTQFNGRTLRIDTAKPQQSQPRGRRSFN